MFVFRSEFFDRLEILRILGYESTLFEDGSFVAEAVCLAKRRDIGKKFMFWYTGKWVTDSDSMSDFILRNMCEMGIYFALIF